jgi:hypothetical protein
MVGIDNMANGIADNEIILEDKEINFILDKMKRNRNIDFGQHRLHSTGCVTYLDYVMLLNRDPQEYDRLIEILIIKEASLPLPRHYDYEEGN